MRIGVGNRFDTCGLAAKTQNGGVVFQERSDITLVEDVSRMHLPGVGKLFLLRLGKAEGRDLVKFVLFARDGGYGEGCLMRRNIEAGWSGKEQK